MYTNYGKNSACNLICYCGKYFSLLSTKEGKFDSLSNLSDHLLLLMRSKLMQILGKIKLAFIHQFSFLGNEFHEII